jgi:hypothetical protein
MCGGFAVAAAVSTGAGRGRALRASLVYHLGKSLSYAVLGLIAAQAGGLLSHGGAELVAGAEADHAHLFELARRVLAWLAGLSFVVFGLAATGLPVLPSRWISSGGAPRPLRALFDAARSLPGSSGRFGLGLANGLLPCGLSWAALALAATGGPGRGAVGLFVFGLSTAPVLLAVGLGGAALAPIARRRLLLVAGPLIVAFGLLTIVRGGIPGAGAEALPPCCQPAPQSGS